MIKLRRFWSPAKLTEIYAHKYDPTRWPEHLERITTTIDIATELCERENLATAADLSCGNGQIINSLPTVATYIDDGKIETCIDEIGHVDLFICTETIEHLEAPWTVLEKIATKTKWLLLSCPLDEDPIIDNYEHYWSFTGLDVDTMLQQSGFTDRSVTILDDDDWTYTYQVWTARSLHG